MKTSSPTSDAILAHARMLVAAGGYNGFSYADIAEAVGIRKASIHHHFPAKADLVRTLVERYREDVEAGIAQLERAVPAPLDQLQAYVRYWEACLADGSLPYCVCAMLGSELPLLPPEVALEVRAHFRFLSAWLASVLARGGQQGAIRLNGTAQVEAEAFMATVHGAMLSARAYGDAAMFGLIMAPLLQRLAASR